MISGELVTVDSATSESLAGESCQGDFGAALLRDWEGGGGKSGHDFRVPEDVVAGECCRGDFRGCGEIRARLCEVHLPVQASG